MTFKKILFSILLASASVHQEAIASSEIFPEETEDNISSLFEQLYTKDEPTGDMDSLTKSLSEKESEFLALKDKLKDSRKHIFYFRLTLGEPKLWNKIISYIPENDFKLQAITCYEERRLLKEQLAHFEEYRRLAEKIKTFPLSQVLQESFNRAKLLSPSPQLNGGVVDITTGPGKTSMGFISANNLTIVTGESEFHMRKDSLGDFLKVKIDGNWTMLPIDQEIKLICNQNGVCMLATNTIDETQIFSKELLDNSISSPDQLLSSEVEIALDTLTRMISINRRVHAIQQELGTDGITEELENEEPELVEELEGEQTEYAFLHSDLFALDISIIDQASKIMIEKLGFKTFDLERNDQGMLEGSTHGLHYRASILALPTGHHDFLTTHTFAHDLVLLRVDDRRAAIKVDAHNPFKLQIRDGVVSLTRPTSIEGL